MTGQQNIKKTCSNVKLFIFLQCFTKETGQIAYKAVCRSVFLTTWHCIFNKNALL